MSVALPTEARQELDGLLPQRSRWRTLVVVVAIGLAVALTWTLPPWLHPQLPASGGGGSSAWQGAPFVLTFFQPDGDQSPVTVRGVDDIPGARVVGAWVTTPLTPGGDFNMAWQAATSGMAVPSDAAVVIEALRAAGAPLDGCGLPQRLASGDRLWVLWQITDCTVGAHAAGEVIPPAGPASVRLRGPLGVTLGQPGPMMISPFGYGIEGTDWLWASGSCPG